MGYIKRFIIDHTALWAEGIGAFLFVVIGTSAVTAIGVSGEATSASVILLSTLAFATTLGWLVFAFAKISGGHFNPAVSTLQLVRGAMPVGIWMSYLIAQGVGALLASITVALLYGTPGVEARLGAPYPLTDMGSIAALVAELLGTTILLLAVVRATQDPQRSAISQGGLVAVGLALGMLVSSGISGGSLNPVRALAPELVIADMTYWWVYLLGPMLAAVIVGGGLRLFQAATHYQQSAPQLAQSAQAMALVQQSSTSSSSTPPHIDLAAENAKLQATAKEAMEHLEDEEAHHELAPMPQPPVISPAPTAIKQRTTSAPSFHLQDDSDTPSTPTPTIPEPLANTPQNPAKPTSNAHTNGQASTGPVKFVDFDRPSDD